MTFNEHLNDLNNERIEKLSTYFKLETDFSNDFPLNEAVFGDMSKSNSLFAAKREWQESENYFRSMLKFVTDNGIGEHELPVK